MDKKTYKLSPLILGICGINANTDITNKYRGLFLSMISLLSQFTNQNTTTPLTYQSNVLKIIGSFYDNVIIYIKYYVENKSFGANSSWIFKPQKN